MRYVTCMTYCCKSRWTFLQLNVGWLNEKIPVDIQHSLTLLIVVGTLQTTACHPGAHEALQKWTVLAEWTTANVDHRTHLIAPELHLEKNGERGGLGFTAWLWECECLLLSTYSWLRPLCPGSASGPRFPRREWAWGGESGLDRTSVCDLNTVVLANHLPSQRKQYGADQYMRAMQTTTGVTVQVTMAVHW